MVFFSHFVVVEKWDSTIDYFEKNCNIMHDVIVNSLEFHKSKYVKKSNVLPCAIFFNTPYKVNKKSDVSFFSLWINTNIITSIFYSAVHTKINNLYIYFYSYVYTHTFFSSRSKLVPSHIINNAHRKIATTQHCYRIKSVSHFWWFHNTKLQSWFVMCLDYNVLKKRIWLWLGITFSLIHKSSMMIHIDVTTFSF